MSNLLRCQVKQLTDKRCYTCQLIAVLALLVGDGQCVMAAGSLMYWSSTSGAAQSSRHVISPNDRRSSTMHDHRRGSSDDVIEQASFVLELSPSCPCPSSAEAEASDEIYLKHRPATAAATAAAKTAAVGNAYTSYVIVASVADHVLSFGKFQYS